MSELNGQMDMNELMRTEGTGNREDGYDAEGRLLDYVPGETKGKAGESAEAEQLPQSPSATAPSGREPGEGEEAIHSPLSTLHSPLSTPSGDARLEALAAEIRAITDQTRGVVISAALAIGRRLLEAKQLCPEGRWLEWLATGVDYSERKAQDMMRLYEEYGRAGAIPESIAALDYSKAVALLTAPAEEREALAERAADEGLSVRQLQGEIKRMKAEALKKQMVIDEFEGKVAGLQDEIARLDGREQEYDAAIVREREAASLADARAKSAEASAEQLRKLHGDAEDRAAASAQRASDAVNRANATAKDLAEARARIAELESREPEIQTVIQLPEGVKAELEDLRRQVARAEAERAAREAERTTGAGPVEKFRWFWANQMKPTFSAALPLLEDVKKEDAQTAAMFATAMIKACRQLMDTLGVGE